MGTAYRGVKHLPDGTFITTKFVVLMWIPIAPIESVRVLDIKPGSPSWPIPLGQRFTIQTVPLDTEMGRNINKKVVKGFAIVVASIIAFLVAMSVLGWLIQSGA